MAFVIGFFVFVVFSVSRKGSLSLEIKKKFYIPKIFQNQIFIKIKKERRIKSTLIFGQ